MFDSVAISRYIEHIQTANQIGSTKMRTLTSYIIYALVIAFLANSLLDMGSHVMTANNTRSQLTKLGV